MPELSELRQVVNRLQNSIEEELKNIRDFKNKCAKDNEFEKSASARDLEKLLLGWKEILGS